MNKHILKKQSGLTIIEFLIAFTITAIISTMIISMILQTTNTFGRGISRTDATTQISLATRYLQKDAAMSYSVYLYDVDDDEYELVTDIDQHPFPVRLERIDWDTGVHECYEYKFEGQDLVRNVYSGYVGINSINNSYLDSSIIVGKYIYIPVMTITVTSPGSGYTSTPDVVISGGGGTGATALALVSGAQEVIELKLTNGGYGYTSSPSVNITGGGGSGATANATILNLTYWQVESSRFTAQVTAIEGLFSTQQSVSGKISVIRMSAW